VLGGGSKVVMLAFGRVESRHMHIRAKCVNNDCAVYSVEKTMVVGLLGRGKLTGNDLICRHCGKPLHITKVNVDDEKQR